MATYYCTARMLSRWKVMRSTSPPEAESTFSEWYVDLKQYGHQHLAVLLNPATCICIVMHAKEFRRHPESVATRLADVLRAIGVPEWKIAHELPTFATTVIADAISDRILYQLEFAWYFADLMLWEGDDLQKVSVELTTYPFEDVIPGVPPLRVPRAYQVVGHCLFVMTHHPNSKPVDFHTLINN